MHLASGCQINKTIIIIIVVVVIIIMYSTLLFRPKYYYRAIAAALWNLRLIGNVLEDDRTRHDCGLLRWIYGH